MGFLHSFTTGSAVDGPGVRVVAWTAGCKWRCRYCHNPDTWTMTNGMPVPLDARGRGAAQVPPRPQGDVRRVHAERRRAADAGPVRGRSCSRRPRRWASTPRSRPTAICGDRLSDAELDQIDLVLLGHQDLGRGAPPGAHREGHRPTLDFARRLAARQQADLGPLRPGAGPDRRPRTIVAAIAEFAAGLGNVERVEVLPFHQMGRFKWERLGLDYTLNDVQPPSAEAAGNACEVFRKAGLKAY